MPTGTLTTPLIKPFTGPVTLGPSSGTITYSDPSTRAATTLTIDSGTLSTHIVEIVPGTRQRKRLTREIRLRSAVKTSKADLALGVPYQLCVALNIGAIRA
jgi:hypothetical protein